MPFKLILSLLAALGGLCLGDCAWGLSTLYPSFAWPEGARSAFLIWGAALGLGLAWAQALAWKLALHWGALAGLRLGVLGLAFTPLALAWPLALRLRLPEPHAFPERKLQLLLAFILISGMALSLALGLWGAWISRALDRFKPGSQALRLGAIAFTFYFLSGAWVIRWNNTGDAPHYLLMAHSLAFDQDVDLADEHRDKEWRRFYDRELGKQMEDQADGSHISEHKPGISLAMAPLYRFFGLAGALWSLCALAALGSALFYLLCLACGYKPGLSYLGFVLFAFGSAWVTQSQLAMAEMPGALCFLAVLAAWKGAIPRVWVGLACAALAWLQVRFYPAAGLIVLADAWMRRREGVLAAAQPFLFWALGFGAFFAFNHAHFGSINPAAAHAQMGYDTSRLVQPLDLPKHVAGLFLDQEYGWLPFAPVLALAFFGWASWWRRDKALFFLALGPALVYFLPVAAFPYWISGMIPNRYMTPLYAAFVLGVVEAWRSWGRGRPAFKWLAALTFFWAWFLTFMPLFAWGRLHGKNLLLLTLSKLVKLDLTAWFPTFWSPRDDSWKPLPSARSHDLADPVNLAWLALVLVLGIFWLRKLLREQAEVGVEAK